MPKPLVALVGRPNVGKSALFNRLVGERRAIVEDMPGTTRDRLYGETSWNGRDFVLVDTGGLDPEATDQISREVRAQAAVAVEDASLILFLTDAVSGVTSMDREVADILRLSDKPVILVANKGDNQERRLAAVEFYELGLGDPIAVSALHGIGTGDLLDAITDQLPPAEEEEVDESVVRVAIVGRPNVGKSSLVNAILGEQRVVVHDVPGTTRDAIDTELVVDDQEFVIIDTAGMRRRGHIEPGLEKYAVLRTLQAIERADVAVLVLDAAEGLADQDMHVAGFVEEAGKGLVVVANKWDLVTEKKAEREEAEAGLRDRLQFVPGVPIEFISARTGQNVERVLPLAAQVRAERARLVPTSKLNSVLRQAVADHQPPTVKGRALRFYYVTQTGVDPPRFLFFMNYPELIHFTYRRYLENRLRQEFGFAGTPIRLAFRGRDE